MKLFMYMTIIAMFMSCSTDYSGTEPKDEKPDVSIDSSGTLVTFYPVKVSWSATMGNETDLDFLYCVTTDTTVTNQEARTMLSAEKWVVTKNKYAVISFPAVPYNSDSIFYHVATKIPYSRLFVYARNSVGTISPVVSRLFLRSNNKPEIETASSEILDFDWNLPDFYEEYYASGKKILFSADDPRRTDLEISWTSSDPDSAYSLEFKCEIFENDLEKNNPLWSQDWAAGTSILINDDVFMNRPYGWYSLVLSIRDDALEEAENSFRMSFEVVSPMFDKGILFLDDTDPSLNPTASYLINGNPDAALTRVF
jgi:hypothetical protein